jgi:zinc protease
MLIVAGKFEPETALKFAQQYFGAIPRPERELDQTYTEEPAQDGDRLVTLRRVGEVPLAGLAYHIPAGAHTDFAAIDVLATALASEPAGRLYDELVKKRQAANVYGMTYALHDPGIAMFVAEAAQGVDSTSLLQGMVDVVESIESRPLTDEEVERARQELLKQRELSVSKTSGVAVELSDWAAQGDWRLFFLYRDRLESVTTEDVNNAAARYFITNNRTAGLFDPTEQPSRATIPQTPDLAEMIGDYQGREQIAQGEAFDAAPLAIEERLTRDQINSGIKVALLPKKTRGESVNLRLSLRYGDLEALQGQATAADLLPSMLSRGTKTMTRQQIQDELDKYRARLRISGSPGVVIMDMETQRGNLIPVLHLLKEMVRTPSFPDEELELLRESRLSSAEQRLADPTSIASNTVQRMISAYDQDDPRYIPTLEEEVERLKTVSIDQIRSLYDNLLQAQNGELSIVGDFDADETLPVISDMLATWSSDTQYVHIPRLSFDNEKGELKHINTPDKAQATYFAAMTLPMKDDHPDYPALMLGNYILGGGSLSSRLGDRVRQQEGLSYGVQSALQASPVDDRTIFYIYAICNPDKADRVNEVIHEEIAKLLQDGITEEELTRQKAGLLQQRELQRTSDSSLAQQLSTHTYAGRTMQFTADLEQKLRDLTIEDVNKALRTHIQPERLYIVLAGDFEKSGSTDGE